MKLKQFWLSFLSLFDSRNLSNGNRYDQSAFLYFNQDADATDQPVAILKWSNEMKQFNLSSMTARIRAVEAVKGASQNHVVIIREKSRSIEANARLHAMLNDISKQAKYLG